MNIEALRVYCEIVRTRSFSKAARALGISQPAASQVVRQLEEDLGVTLVDRSQRPLIPTAAGQRYFAGIQCVLKQYDELNAELRQSEDEHTGDMRLAAIYSVGIQAMSRCIQLFQAKHRKARIRVEYLRPNRVIEAVINDACDMGVLSYPSSSQVLTVIPLWTEKMVLVCTPEHRLSIRKGLHASDLEQEDLVSFDQDLTIRRVIDRALAKRNVHVNVTMEFDNIESIKQAIEAGVGIAILPEPSVRREAEAGRLVSIPLAIPELVRPIGALIRRRRQVYPLVSTFVELLKQHPTI